MRSDLIRTEKETLSEVAYRYLKEQIISGVIREGDVITENNIGRALGMSRTPVKKALTQLESENYVRCLDGIGTVVVGLSLSDLRDIYDVRISMELLALKTSIHNIRPAEIAELRGDFQRELEAYRRAGGISDQRIAEIDARFHQLIVDKSNNNYIKNLVRVLAAQIRRYQAVAYSLTDTFEESAGQHLGILQKIEERNLDEARELLRAHIEWSYKELAAVML
ncbi:DNA-binding GntR family transcriptional regulator [Fusobacterium naviforme]|nr:GntR family transcriptional regulator [Moryella indoligenes]KAB0577548.1 GntR family transcriptional regulator [Fusobacterium naviforme]PSL10360.1 DNA-binding GntR family transcriptional regulator [Fusobacterium naviforme]STO28058.1 Uncharacterized HTH-type transcriptional regulator ydfH [Fusobacterium naviforme]